ncbi:DUF1657 domain-containing protein [Shimazuella sp. AN120528]|uniref:DUF1657 domain-containing protein n=1 Tax=Shimazuella soli TaxID=1892854 RepID=UPI001F0D1488|nr:DUF1657 domain-containing protein [Shimazuella soli]MCH5583760.1 DUF1657 domain-containing protein [Shimazuella soli]
MTTYAKVKQTLVSLEGAKSTMETLEQITQKAEAAQSLRYNAQKLDVVINRLKKRVQKMEFEEPNYKGF